VNSNAAAKIPKCPACGANIEFLRIRCDKPFPCPACGRQLMAAEPYHKRFLLFCRILGAAVAAAATYRYWLSAPRTDAGVWHAFAILWLTCVITSLAAIFFGSIFVKRIFPPKLEDYEEYSKQARYTAL